MADPYVGEIRMFAGNFAPVGWLFCQGQVLSIADYDVLFALIGTTYGGDGVSTFALPDLSGRVPIHQGNGVVLGERAGVETVTLTSQQIPAHTHALRATTAPGATAVPTGNVLAASGSANVYRPAPAATPLSAQSVAPAGGSQPHDNMQPFLCVNHIISLYGIYPSPS